VLLYVRAWNESISQPAIAAHARTPLNLGRGQTTTTTFAAGVAISYEPPFPVVDTWQLSSWNVVRADYTPREAYQFGDRWDE
jgi:hypothetical protein